MHVLHLLKNRFEDTTLSKKILVIIAIMSSFIPTILISILAFSYYNLGVKSIFNEQINKLVSNTLYVSDAYLQEHKQNVKIDAISIARDIDINLPVLMEDPNYFEPFLNKQAQLRKLSEVFVFDLNDGLVAKNSYSLSSFFEKVSKEDIEAANKQDVVLIDNPYGKVRALVKIRGFYTDTYLIVGKFVDSSIAENLRNTKGSADQYQMMVQEIGSAQTKLEYSFFFATIIMCLASIFIGAKLSRIIITPINNLVLATEKITSGDYNVKVIERSGRDETAILSRAFNTMITTISEQREKLLNYNKIIDERRRFIEAVLAEISAGVITINKDGYLSLFNTSADELLEISDSAKSNHFKSFFPEIENLIMQISDKPGSIVSENIEVVRGSKKSNFFVRIGMQLNEDQLFENYIITFDDISELVAAQRSAAWADVARRIAHEIKNPLTPIQLSAERIKKKYSPQITSDTENFIRYIDTIIRHVGDIEKIVEEFIHFARIPSPTLRKNELVKTINDIVFSQKYVFPNIEYSFDTKLASCYGYYDSSQISQVLLNILKNAAESIELKHKARNYTGQIQVLLSEKDDEFAQILIKDNGLGIDAEVLERIFEPYVTTKVKGTGLGLPIVKKIIEDHGGQLKISSNELGAEVLILIRLYKSQEIR